MTVDDRELFSQLVGSIYDAALNPDDWPQVLEALVSFVGGRFGNVFAQDEGNKSAATFYTYGIPPAYLDSYFTKFVRQNPLFPATLFFDVERVIRQEEIIPLAEFKKTQFYREWARPLGYAHALAALLDKSPVSCSAIAIGRGEDDGSFDHQAVHRMQLIVPHVRRAFMIGQAIDSHKVEAGSLAATFDGVAAGVLLVDPMGRIVHANRRALTMLAEGTTIRADAARLAVTDAAADAALREIFASADGGDDAVGAKGVAIAITGRDGERYVCHVLPLTSGTRRAAGISYSAVAAVFLRKTAVGLSHPLEMIARTFDLTAAELRVLMTIVEVGGAPDVAHLLGISEETVRTHLKRIFEKTSTSSQADLVRLVVGYMSPLGG